MFVSPKIPVMIVTSTPIVEIPVKEWCFWNGILSRDIVTWNPPKMDFEGDIQNYLRFMYHEKVVGVAEKYIFVTRKYLGNFWHWEINWIWINESRYSFSRFSSPDPLSLSWIEQDSRFTCSQVDQILEQSSGKFLYQTLTQNTENIRTWMQSLSVDRFSEAS